MQDVLSLEAGLEWYKKRPHMGFPSCTSSPPFLLKYIFPLFLTVPYGDQLLVNYL